MTNYTVGQTIRGSEVHLLPPGTVLNEGYYRTVVLDNGHLHRNGNGQHFSGFGYRGERFTIEKVGIVDHWEDNVDGFRQRIRTMCRGGATANSVPIEPVNRALDRLGAVRNPPLGVGMWVHLQDNEVNARVGSAAGAIVGVGDPNTPDAYLQVDARRWVNAETRSFPGPLRGTVAPLVRVLHLDNPETDAYARPVTEEDREQIAVLRGQAWQIGRRAKLDNSWCGQFENIVWTLGIGEGLGARVSADTLPPEPSSTVVVPEGARSLNAAEQNALPEGAIVAWAGGGGADWCWCVRDDTSPYDPRTTHLMGPNAGHFNRTMRLVWDGSGPMMIQIPSAEVFDAVPVGSMLAHESRVDNPAYQWVKEAPNRWRNAATDNTSSDRGFIATGGGVHTSWRLTRVGPAQ